MKREENFEKYNSRLREKMQLLDTFRRKSVMVKDAINSKDISGLNLHLKERQRLIDMIKSCDKECEGFEKKYSFSMEKLSQMAKDLVLKCKDQIRGLLKSIAEIDTECGVLTQAEYDLTKNDVLKARRGFQVTRGYGDKRYRHPRFLDMKR